MGLSEEERIRKIHYSVMHITEYGELLDSNQGFFIGCHSGIDKLKILIDDLWVQTLKIEHNASHWLMGSDSGNTVTFESRSIWGTILNEALWGLSSESILKEQPEKKEFDPFDGFLDIPGLLGQVNINLRHVFTIYQWIEQLVYALRRYDDELLKSYEGLSALICKIQGTLFNIFQGEEAFPKAYVLNRVCALVYGNMYKQDVLTTNLMKIHFHHDISRPMEQSEELKWLAERHIRLVKAQEAKKLTIGLRAEVALELAGRRFHYEHNMKNLLTGLKGCKGINTKALERQFKLNAEAHDKREKKDQKEYKGPNELEIYGFID